MKLTETKLWWKIRGYMPKTLYNQAIITIGKYKAFKFRGNKTQCPICHKKYRDKFEDCPNCGSCSRHRLVYMFLKRKTDVFTKKTKILQFAPEYSLHRVLSKLKNIDYIGADLSKSPRVNKIIDMTNISFSDNTFDFIISNHVLEHIDDDMKAMQETVRVLKSTGHAIHLVPIDKTQKHTFEDKSATIEEERLKSHHHPDHRRIYGFVDYKKKLEKAGFEVQVISPLDFMSEKELNYFSISKEKDIYFLSLEA